MPAISGSAPGKIILFGEHAVVYGQPAIAVPVSEVKARAIITPDILGTPGGIQISAPDIHVDSPLAELPLNDAIAKAVSGTLKLFDITAPPAFKLRVTSTIPLAAGLGSGAAVSVAVSRAVAGFLGVSLSSAQVSAIAFEVEKIHHGTPSGIDNTVIAHQLPVYFVKGQAIESFDVPNPFTIVIADTGIKSSTAVSVGDVRAAWEANQDKYNRIFNDIGDISRQARQHIENGVPEKMGELMDTNHELLSQMGVSSPELDSLTKAARTAGALGAKLSGGGRGGNVIALVTKNIAAEVEQALLTAGATYTIITTVANQGAR